MSWRRWHGSVPARRRIAALAACAAVAGACGSPGVPVPAVTETASLKEVFRDAFRVGAALNEAQFSERDTIAVALVRRHFNTITPENVLKWESVHPAPGRFEFAAPDR